MYFFFQAEDGIRDLTVTGVQTCALPISVREKDLMDDFTRRIAREQFALGHMQVGAVALPEIFPVLEGQMVPIEDISKMVHEGKLESPVAEDIERKYEQFRQEFTVVYRKRLTLSRE